MLDNHMYSEWYREGDFYQKNHDKISCPVIYQVKFKNVAPVITIKKIQIMHYFDQATRIIISPSEFHINDVRSFCEQYFAKACNVPFGSNEIFITFEKENLDELFLKLSELNEPKKTSETLLKEKSKELFERSFKLTRLLNYLNRKYNRVEFSNDIIRELENVFKFLISNRNKTKTAYERHSLSDEIPILFHVNPLRIKSNKLLCYLMYSNKCTTKEISEFLYQGENPNQTNVMGDSPLSLGLNRLSMKDWKKLLYYGADPRRRPYYGIGDSSVIELTKKFNMVEHFNLIMLAYSAPKKSLSEFRLKIKDMSTLSINNEIITTIKFTNGCKVITKLITAESFHDKKMEMEKDIVFKLFSAGFRHSAGDHKKVKESFDSNFSLERNKWVELFVDLEVKRIIGFSLYKVVKEDGKIVVKWEYAAIESNSKLRSCGGNSLLFFRAACAIAALKPNDIVELYCLPVSYFSFRLLEGHLITPMFQPPHLMKTNQKLANDEFQTEVIIHNGCYVESDCLLEVTESHSSVREMSFKEECFNEFFLGKKKKKRTDKETNSKQEAFKEKTRAAVVSTVIGRGFVERLSEQVQQCIEIQIKPHIEQFAMELNNNRNLFLPLFNTDKLVDNRDLRVETMVDERWRFWTGEKYSLPLRSKL